MTTTNKTTKTTFLLTVRNVRGSLEGAVEAVNVNEESVHRQELKSYNSPDNHTLPSIRKTTEAGSLRN